MRVRGGFGHSAGIAAWARARRAGFKATAYVAALTMAATPVFAAPLTLTGDYISVGLSDWGTFGQNGNAPVGIQYDSTGAGAFDNNFDYLTPGTPFDGFSVTFDAATVSNNNNLGSGQQINGVLTDESGNGADNRAVWIGTYSPGGLDTFTVTRDFSFNNDERRVTIVTTIKAERDLTGVLFSHQNDPDAAGESATNNQLGVGSIAPSDLAYSQAPISQYILALYSTDPIAHHAAITSSPWSQVPADYLAGTNAGNGDNAIGMGFDLGDMLTGDELTFTYYLLFGNNLTDLTGILGGGGLAPKGFTPNQAGVGGGLDSLGSGNPVYDAVANLPTDNAVREAMDALSGETHSSAGTVMIDASRYVRVAANDRVRQGFANTSSQASMALNYAPEQNVVKSRALGVSFWGQAFGSWGYTATGGAGSRVDHSLGGFVLGGDVPVGDVWRIGLAGGYTSTSLTAKARSSSASIDNYTATLYGGAQFGAVGLRFGGTYGLHEVDATRDVVFPGFSNRLTSDYQARSAQLFGEVGYAKEFGVVALEPFAGLSYVRLDTDGFTERGGAAALTSFDSQDSTTYSTLGLRSAIGIALSDNRIVNARLTLGWRHAFGDVSPDTRFAFAGGQAFTVAGAPIDRDALVVDLGLDMDVAENANIGLSYSGQMSGNAQDHGVRANFIIAF